MRSAPLILLVFLILCTQSLAQQRTQPHIVGAKNLVAACRLNSPSNVEISRCYQKAAQFLAIELKKKLSARAIDFQAMDPKLVGGEQQLRDFQQYLARSDAAWEEVMRSECDNITKATFYGGSGLYQQLCEITALAARLDVMEYSAGQ